MARIRTIKPEFWTDEKVVQLPYEARLLFIGLWNFADDDGRLYDEPERIRMQVFPSDMVDVDDLIDLLVGLDIIERYVSPDGESILYIPGFSEHQRVSHPTPSKIPLENSRKIAIPPAVRRAVAERYGCAPGESKDVECFYCGDAGRIAWHRRKDGRPGGWVSFSGVELDHLEAESSGGPTADTNLVLACKSCNRSKGNKDVLAFISRRFQRTPEDSARIPESSGSFPPEGKGREGNIAAEAASESAPEPSGRRRDLHFEMFCRLFEYDWNSLNETERGKVNKAVALVKQSRGSPEDIEHAFTVYPTVMPPGTKRTAMAIASNWQDLMNANRKQETEREQLLARYPRLA